MAASTCVESVRCCPRVVSQPKTRPRSSSLSSKSSSALLARRRSRNALRTEKSKPGSVNASPRRYFQSIRARTASAAWRSARWSRNCLMVPSAKRQGGRPGWPSSGKQAAKSSSWKIVPRVSRRSRYGLPLGKAARATRAVSSGPGSRVWGRSDITDVLLLREWRHTAVGGRSIPEPAAQEHRTTRHAIYAYFSLQKIIFVVRFSKKSVRGGVAKRTIPLLRQPIVTEVLLPRASIETNKNYGLEVRQQYPTTSHPSPPPLPQRAPGPRPLRR